MTLSAPAACLPYPAFAQENCGSSATSPSLSNPISKIELLSPTDMTNKRPMDDQESQDESAPKSRKTMKRQPSTKATARPPRTPHKLVERRYRDNLKAHLDRLTMKLPLVKDSYACFLDIEDSERAVKGPSKAVVIAAASQYIEQLESDKENVNDFVRRLQEQVAGLQKLVQCDDCAIMRYMESMQMVAKKDSAAC
ncbi:hypothetical protein LTR08_001547 [Meristemomyces frigidus]|nr:hypothetical protein LTR08_001547 [Meristemomyces frigidus]